MCAKPILKWAGGKTKIMNQIHEHISSRPLGIEWSVKGKGRYIEPFTGSSAAYLGLVDRGVISTKNVILSDINEVLIVTLDTIRQKEKLDLVINQLEKMESKFTKNKEDYYYSSRDVMNNSIINNPKKNPVKTAAYMIFLNKTCFNGLWRINTSGAFNTPLGRPSAGKITILNQSDLKSYSEAVKNVKFICQDWKKTISSAGRGDLIYVDPPYLPIQDDEYVFRDYTGEGFSNSTHLDLAKSCAEAATRGAKVIISNNYSPKIEKLYIEAAKESGARISRTKKIQLKRTMKKVSKEKREKIEELLIFMAEKQ